MAGRDLCGKSNESVSHIFFPSLKLSCVGWNELGETYFRYFTHVPMYMKPKHLLLLIYFDFLPVE